MDWEKEIERQIPKSDVFLVFVSSHSKDKRGVFQKEIRIALREIEKRLEGDIYIIPMMIDVLAIPDQLKQYQWIEMGGPGWKRKLFKSLELAAKQLGKEVRLSDFISQNVGIEVSEVHESTQGAGKKVLFTEGFYPQIVSGISPATIAEVNAIVKAHVHEQIVAHRADALEYSNIVEVDLSEWDEFDHENNLWVNFEIAHLDEELCSISFSNSMYNLGAAHPNHWWTTINLLLDPVADVGFHQLFNADGNKEFVDDVLRSLYDPEISPDENMFGSGTLEEIKDELLKVPDFDDYQWAPKFVIDSEGITFLFDPYEIGSYALGMLAGKMPWHTVAKYVGEDYRSWQVLKDKFVK